MNNIIKEFKKNGLIKSLQFEKYIDQGETTQTGNIAVGMQRYQDDERREKKDEIEDMVEMIQCAKSLNNAYKKMTGKDLHELYCPQCKAYDLSPADNSPEDEL